MTGANGAVLGASQGTGHATAFPGGIVLLLVVVIVVVVLAATRRGKRG
jgi:hypothetical protein